MVLIMGGSLDEPHADGVVGDDALAALPVWMRSADGRRRVRAAALIGVPSAPWRPSGPWTP